MLVHIGYNVNKGVEDITIWSIDCDVGAVCPHDSATLQVKDFGLKLGKKGKKSRYIPMHKENMGDALSHLLPKIHAFSGCDCQFIRRKRQRTSKMVKVIKNIQNLLKALIRLVNHLVKLLQQLLRPVLSYYPWFIVIL